MTSLSSFRRVGFFERLSIRHVLTLWYIFSLAVILAIFSSILYFRVSTTLMRDIDRTLLLQADSVADKIFSFWKAERTAEEPPSGNWVGAPSANLAEEIARGRFKELILRWNQKTDQLDLGPPIRLIGLDAQPLAVSTWYSQLELPQATEAVEPVLAGQTVYHTLPYADTHVRVISRPIYEDGKLLYGVQVAAQLDQVEASILRLQKLLTFLVPVTLVVTSAVGWLLAVITLRPINRMISDAQRIGAKNLHQRVDVPRSGDEIERLGVTFNDILDRLEQTFKRMRQFSAAASHELRTPLTAMKGELEVALRRVRSQQEYQEVLRTHLNTVDEMAATVEELLALARDETAGGAIEWRPVDISALVIRAGDAWQGLVRSKGVSLELAPSEPLWVFGEQRLLERLVSNLVDNAVRHTSRGGRVIIGVAQKGDEAHISVRDNGEGIPEEELPHIFDRFFKPRVEDKQSRPSGLGLGFCRWIAEAHNGQIDIASPAKQGVLAIVRFPLVSPVL